MALPQDGQNANGLTKVTEIPKGKELIFIDPTTNEGGIITLEDLTTQILKNLTSQTFTLDQGNITLIEALNKLNSNSPVLRSIKIDGMDANNQTLYILEIGRLVQLSARFVAEKNFEAGSIIASDLPAPILDKDRVIKAYNSNVVETAIFNITSHKLILKTNLTPTTDVRIDMSYIC